MVHIIEYILYSSVEFVSSKHCNYSGRVNCIEGRKRLIGSFNQEVFKESGRQHQSSFYIVML
jgi:hypothetical protein